MGLNLSVSVGPIDVELFGKSAAFPIHNSQTEHSTQRGRSASRPSVTSTSESKRSSNATSLNTSHRSKRQKVDGAPSAGLSMLQCTSYALEMLSHGGLWSHIISALVTDDTIQLLYFDRSIILVSRPVNFLEDSSHFVTMLQAITNLSLLQLGYVELLKPAPFSDNPRQTTNVFDGLELKLNDGTRLEFGSTVFHHGIIGRGTCVVRAKCIEKRKGYGADDGAWAGPLIVKLSWPAKSRMLENGIIRKVAMPSTVEFSSTYQMYCMLRINVITAGD